MPLAKDLREFIALLNSQGVEYLIVGAHALAFHGRPRYTGDLDVLVRVSVENASRLEKAVHAFGFSPAGISAADFLAPGRVIQLGRAPLRIDLLTSITGVEFEEAWKRRVAAELDHLPVYFLDRESLIRNKRATGRAQDVADLEALGEKP